MYAVGDRRGNIAEVGEQCGYSDANYFIRCFKERYGVTPAVFRKERERGKI